MPKNKFFTFAYALILILAIIWLLNQVTFIFRPIVITIQTLFIPFLLAGVLFYFFRPVVDFLNERKIPRSLAIVIVYLAVIGVAVALGMAVGPLLQQQVNRLIENAPQFADMLLRQWEYIRIQQQAMPDFMDEVMQAATEGAQAFLQNIGHVVANVGNILSGIASFLVALVIIPFILFYMLKDGHHFSDSLVYYLAPDKKREAKSILSDMNRALHTYVLGQAVVSLCVGVMVFVGYSIISLEYSLILALVAMFTNLIPFVGPFIGTFPAVIVGLMESPWMMLQVIIVVVIAQQIESSLISPQVMGRVLEVHPLTIILLILVAGSLAGLVGLILAVPIYAVVKVIFKHAVRLYRLKYS